MKITGKHVLPIDAASLWPLLQDAEVLARIAPGVSRIEEVGPDNYKAISDISIGPVRGSFAGTLILKDKVEGEAMTMTLLQESKIGNAEANINMVLTPQGKETTLITYTGNAKVSGKLATMGQRILGGVVSSLSRQVFQELEDIIEERKVEAPSVAPSDTSIPSTSPKSTKKSFIQLLIEKIRNLWK